jgi:hypothetical protein
MHLLVALFEDREAAKSLQARLTSAGIESEVRNDAALQSVVFWAKPAAAERVTVASDAFEKARDLIQEWDRREQVLKAAIRCPECASPRVEYPQYTRKFITPILIELMVSLGVGEKSYYCTDCQYTWRKRDQARLERQHAQTPPPMPESSDPSKPE